jgi:hypothetical protein
MAVSGEHLQMECVWIPADSGALTASFPSHVSSVHPIGSKFSLVQVTLKVTG